MKTRLNILLTLFLFSAPSYAENKMVAMYQLFYLPFSIHFQLGQDPTDIVPYVFDNKLQANRTLSSNEMDSLETIWKNQREQMKKKSLFVNTEVALNKSNRITHHFISHKVGLKRNAMEALNLNDQIKEKEALRKLASKEQAEALQLMLLRSFLKPLEEEQFNFFLVSANWCESCTEYKVILETLAKQINAPDLNIHAITIQDTNPPQVFDSAIIKQLFLKKASHESIPRFIAIQKKADGYRIFEESEAIDQLIANYFAPRKGYLDTLLPFLKK